MSLDYGRPAPPEQFIILKLMPLGLPVGPERTQSTPLPCYVVTSVVNHSDRFLLQATVSVHTLAQGDGATEMGRAQASDAAWAADDLLLSQTPGDLVTLHDGRTAGGWIDPNMSPVFADYRDPFIKRYLGRYDALLRFQPR
ncbi:hypothetical protein BN000_00646 [Mycobacterium europaeum]|uniref:Uncharacterized protein n=1 Tax=Mycobacterium europaeum TaxID=761804 RepID=A0A0U1CZZ9_9MYCO|nr:hypothetical protein [Mycobacterium europaeum]CQD03777.1 hypothetical protein BN000_00646 [Mycobacterium europaeum]